MIVGNPMTARHPNKITGRWIKPTSNNRMNHYYCDKLTPR